MEVYLTRHAKNRMRLYEITAEEIHVTLREPDQVTEGAYGRRQAWKRGPHGQWLRVTFVDEGTRRIVITITPTRQGPGGAHAD